MNVTRAGDWVLRSTTRFDAHVAYLRDVLGLPLRAQGVPIVDTQFRRYARFGLPDGVTLEVVEPLPELTHLHDVTILCLTVDDLAGAVRDQPSLSPVFTDGSGWGWTYLRAPDGAVYQLQGPVRPG